MQSPPKVCIIIGCPAHVYLQRVRMGVIMGVVKVWLSLRWDELVLNIFEFRLF